MGAEPEVSRGLRVELRLPFPPAPSRLAHRHSLPVHGRTDTWGRCASAPVWFCWFGGIAPSLRVSIPTQGPRRQPPGPTREVRESGALLLCNCSCGKNHVSVSNYVARTLLHSRLRGRQRKSGVLPRVSTAGERPPGFRAPRGASGRAASGAPPPAAARAAVTPSGCSGCRPFPWARELHGTPECRKQEASLPYPNWVH